MNSLDTTGEVGNPLAAGTSTVLTEIIGGDILQITLNRPNSRNSINRELGIGLSRALDQLESDERLLVGVLTGAGKGFSSGADLKAVLAGEDPLIGASGFAGIAERALTKPLIVAIEGFALAGGLEVALACDILVASRGAILGLPEPKRGLVASGGGVLRLALRLPHHVAMELALTGEPISAERAYDLGLVSQLTDPGAALPTALALARKIAANAPMAVAATKAIITNAASWPPEVAFARQRELAHRANTSVDTAEGALAFLEKRAAVWSGR